MSPKATFREMLPLLELMDGDGKFSVTKDELESLIYNPYALRIPYNMVASFTIPKQWGTSKLNREWLKPESRVKALYGGSDGILYVVTCENNVNKVHAILHRQDQNGLGVVSSFYVKRSWKLFNENKANGTHFKIIGLHSERDEMQPVVYAYLNFEDGHTNVMGEHGEALYLGSRPYVRGYVQVFGKPDALQAVKKTDFPSFNLSLGSGHWEVYLQNLSLLRGGVINRMTFTEVPSLSTSVCLEYGAQHQVRPPNLLVDKNALTSSTLYRWGSEKTNPWFTLLSPLFYNAELKEHCYWGYDVTDLDNPRICLMKAPDA